MERCPGEWWVINDRARMAGVCLWLTWFDPKCLVTVAIGQSCSLWTAVRIPGAIRWSAWWAWVNGEVGEEEEVQNEGSNGYNYTQQQREVLVLPMLHDLRALGPPPPTPSSLVPKTQTYLCHWGALLFCYIAEHNGQQETEHTNLNCVRLLSHKDGHSSTACQARRRDTWSSVVLKHASSVTATSRSASPSWTSYC